MNSNDSPDTNDIPYKSFSIECEVLFDLFLKPGVIIADFRKVLGMDLNRIKLALQVMDATIKKEDLLSIPVLLDFSKLEFPDNQAHDYLRAIENLVHEEWNQLQWKSLAIVLTKKYQYYG